MRGTNRNVGADEVPAKIELKKVNVKPIEHDISQLRASKAGNVQDNELFSQSRISSHTPIPHTPSPAPNFVPSILEILSETLPLEIPDSARQELDEGPVVRFMQHIRETPEEIVIGVYVWNFANMNISFVEKNYGLTLFFFSSFLNFAYVFL